MKNIYEECPTLKSDKYLLRKTVLEDAEDLLEVFRMRTAENADITTQRVLIHGLGQTPLSWEKTIAGMVEKEKVVCPDLPALLKDKEVNYVNLYGAFSEYCDTFLEPLDLCGLSLGGVLALHYGIEHPSKVHSLVLIGTQYKMPKRLLAFQNIIFRFLPNSIFGQMGFAKRDFIELSRSMIELDFSGSLEQVKCPVLVMCGEKDNANKKAAEELAKYLANATIQMITGAGHEVNVDKPEKLAEAVNSFWKDVL